MVGNVGLEPTRLATTVFETALATYYNNSPFGWRGGLSITASSYKQAVLTSINYSPNNQTSAAASHSTAFPVVHTGLGLPELIEVCLAFPTILFGVGLIYYSGKPIKAGWANNGSNLYFRI